MFRKRDRGRGFSNGMMLPVTKTTMRRLRLVIYSQEHNVDLLGLCLQAMRDIYFVGVAWLI